MNEELKNILERVNCLYQKYGIKSVTMDDVARELGISKKTLYNHVKDKTELVTMAVDIEMASKETCFRDIFNKNLNAIDELLEINRFVNDMVKEYNPSREYDLRKYYPELYAKIRDINMNRMYEAARDNIIKGKKEGLYRNELDETLIAKLHVARIIGMHENPMMTLEEYTSLKTFMEIITYHIRGIANERGIQYFERKIKNQEI
ncbi:MAG: TetR/AcrR family transcriptional regulator [Bacteroidota bacterium]